MPTRSEIQRQNAAFTPIAANNYAAPRNMMRAEQQMADVPFRGMGQLNEIVTGQPSTLPPNSLTMQPVNQFLPPELQDPSAGYVQSGVTPPVIQTPGTAPAPSTAYGAPKQVIANQPANQLIPTNTNINNTGFSPIGSTPQDTNQSFPTRASAPTGQYSFDPLTPFVPEGNTSFASNAWGNTKEALSNAWEGIGGWQGLNTGLQTATGLAQVYQGFQALDLSKDQYNFQKNAWQKNFAMQKDAYDRNVADVESRKAFFTKDDNKGA